jgi:hypothetical protein
MRFPIGETVFCLFVLLFSTGGQAASCLENGRIRPTFGYGVATSGDESGAGYHAGIRLLADASPTKRYGIEMSYLSPFANKESLRHQNYLALGIILEQSIYEQFVVTIGTLGYFGLDQNKNNPVGLLSDIGWEPRFGESAQAFVGVRFETIFDTSTVARTSLSVGLKF